MTDMQDACRSFLEALRRFQLQARDIEDLEGKLAQDIKKKAEIPQPPLPVFYQRLQIDDSPFAPFRYPCQIRMTGLRPFTAGGAAGTSTRTWYGSLDSGGWIRLIPHTTTLFPGFTLSIRQNHFEGEDLKKSQQARAAARKSGDKVPKYTRHGFPADTYSNDHVQVDFEYAFDQFEPLNITVQAHPTQPGKQVAVLQLTVKGNGRGMKIPRQSTGMPFAAGSEQAVLSDQILHATGFVLHVPIDINPPALQKWRSWMATGISVRSLSNDPGEHDDWYFRRMDGYKADAQFPFDLGVSNPYQDYPTPAHLISTADNTLTFREIYAPNNTGVVRSHYPNMGSYIRHQVPGHLWERDESVREKKAIYDDERITLPVRLTELRPNHWQVDVQVKHDRLRGVSKVVPRQETEVFVYIDGFSTRSEDTAFKGTVCATTPEEFDFSATCVYPAEWQEKEQVFREGSYEAFVRWDDQDPTALRRLQTLEYAAVYHSNLEEAGDTNKFQLRNIICDAEDAGRSPNFMQDFLDGINDREVLAQIEQIRATDLDDEQGEVLNSALSGVVGNLLLVQGFPGTGKTWTLGKLVLVFMLLKRRVLVTSQSNLGVLALLEAVIGLVEAEESLAFLRGKIVHLQTEQKEENLARHLASGGAETTSEFKHSKYWMARHIADWCNDHPGDELARDYFEHLRSREEGRNVSQWCEPRWTTVRDRLRQIIFEQALMLSATTFVAAEIRSRQFPASIAILDEAAMATDADLLMAILRHLGVLDLVLLAGDPRQLEPVMKSTSQHRNALGNVVGTSVLHRLLEGWRTYRVVTLKRNYRGHPSTFHMPSELWYDGEMIAGGDPSRWDTPLARNIDRMFSNVLTRSVGINTSTNRQIFLDVDSFHAREEHDTSIYNLGGINAIVNVVGRLQRDAQVQPREIGVLTMYNADKSHMIRALRTAQLAGNADDANEVEVSTVDSYQGKQKAILIVHFVTARRNMPKEGDSTQPHTYKHPFGFVANAKRLCVSTTRAQQFQIMVGNLSIWETWIRSANGKEVTKEAESMVGVAKYVRQHMQVVDDWRRAR